MSNSDYASNQLNMIQNRINEAAHSAGREASEISLVGAAKQQSNGLIKHFNAAGLKHIGENYLSEAINRQVELISNTLTWHFIGKIQSNKAAQIAEHFNWVHSIDRIKIAKHLNAHTPKNKILQVLVQLNIDDEISKSGVSANEASELCLKIQSLENLHLRGFMLIPKARIGIDEQRKPFSVARKLLEQLNQTHNLRMDTLSMGMSNDLEAAILEGSTIIRIGTDLFGARSN